MAVTERGPFIVTVQGSTLQSPLQPSNVEVPSAAALSVTTVPGGNGASHVPGQSMPDGLLVTVPPPVEPSKSTESC